MKIPPGYRRLRRGEVIQSGDRYWSHVLHDWDDTGCSGLKVGERETGEVLRNFTYIRKLPERRKDKQ